ncbi:MAG: hypothetical protein AAGK01_06060 [Pseudomonadota bacterium]
MIRVFALFALAYSVLGALNQLQAEAPPEHHFIFQADTAPLESQSEAETLLSEAMVASLNIVEGRLDAIGGLAYQLDYRGGDRIGLILIGENARQLAQDVFGIQGDLSFRLVNEAVVSGEGGEGISPSGSEILPMAEGANLLAVRLDGGIAGKHLDGASLGFNEGTGEPAVNVRFDEAGKEQFAALTQANIGKRLAIVLDGRILSAPVILEPITDGIVQISGSFTHEEAQRLAVTLWGGALPLRFYMIEHSKAEAAE